MKRASVLAVLMAVSGAANAGELSGFFELGSVFYEEPPCSLWHHKCNGSATKMDTRATGYRVGLEYKFDARNWFDGDGVSVWYKDGDEYGITADACDDEGHALSGAPGCPVDSDMYYVTGSIRALGASYRARFGSVFGIALPGKLVVEIGAGHFRQAFKLEKDDGHRLQETVHGFGTMFGAGFEFRKGASLNVYKYTTDIGATIENGASPAGTGGDWFVGVRVQR